MCWRLIVDVSKDEYLQSNSGKKTRVMVKREIESIIEPTTRTSDFKMTMHKILTQTTTIIRLAIRYIKNYVAFLKISSSKDKPMGSTQFLTPAFLTGTNSHESKAKP